MSLTVGELKKLINNMNDDTIIRDEQNSDFIHIIASNELRLSTRKPIGYCNRSGEYVYPSVLKGYSAFSPELEEDLYLMEWTPFTVDDVLTDDLDLDFKEKNSLTFHRGNATLVLFKNTIDRTMFDTEYLRDIEHSEKTIDGIRYFYIFHKTLQ